MPINGPARVSNPSGARAVRNPTYGPGGNIVGSGSAPGLTNLSFARNNFGQGRNLSRQLALLNRRDPREAGSLTEEELRAAAKSRLRG